MYFFKKYECVCLYTLMICLTIFTNFIQMMNINEIKYILLFFIKIVTVVVEIRFSYKLSMIIYRYLLNTRNYMEDIIMYWAFSIILIYMLNVSVNIISYTLILIFNGIVDYNIWISAVTSSFKYIEIIYTSDSFYTCIPNILTLILFIIQGFLKCAVLVMPMKVFVGMRNYIAFGGTKIRNFWILTSLFIFVFLYIKIDGISTLLIILCLMTLVCYLFYSWIDKHVKINICQKSIDHTNEKVKIINIIIIIFVLFITILVTLFEVAIHHSIFMNIGLAFIYLWIMIYLILMRMDIYDKFFSIIICLPWIIYLMLIVV